MAPSVADIEVAPVPVVIRSLPERAIPVEAVAVKNNSSVKPPSPVDEVAAIETPRACFDRAWSILSFVPTQRLEKRHFS